MVSCATAETVRTVSSADARPQYTRTSATASSSSPVRVVRDRPASGRWVRDATDLHRREPTSCAVVCQGLMVPGEGSVAPVHSGRDLADNRTPTQTCLLCPDFPEPSTAEEPAHSTAFRGPQGLVQVVER